MWTTVFVVGFSATASTPAVTSRARVLAPVPFTHLEFVAVCQRALVLLFLQSSWLTGPSRSSRTWTRRPELWNTFSAKFQTRSTTEYASYRLSSECEWQWRNTDPHTHTQGHTLHTGLWNECSRGPSGSVSVTVVSCLVHFLHDSHCIRSPILLPLSAWLE